MAIKLLNMKEEAEEKPETVKPPDDTRMQIHGKIVSNDPPKKSPSLMRKIAILSSLAPKPLFNEDFFPRERSKPTKAMVRKIKKNKVRAKMAKESKRRNRGNR